MGERFAWWSFGENWQVDPLLEKGYMSCEESLIGPTQSHYKYTAASTLHACGDINLHAVRETFYSVSVVNSGKNSRRFFGIARGKIHVY